MGRPRRKEVLHIRRPFQSVFATLENDFTARRIASSALCQRSISRVRDFAGSALENVNSLKLWFSGTRVYSALLFLPTNSRGNSMKLAAVTTVALVPVLSLGSSLAFAQSVGGSAGSWIDSRINSNTSSPTGSYTGSPTTGRSIGSTEPNSSRVVIISKPVPPTSPSRNAPLNRPKPSGTR